MYIFHQFLFNRIFVPIEKKGGLFYHYTIPFFWFGLISWHINHCRLFNAKSSFIHIKSSISNNSLQHKYIVSMSKTVLFQTILFTILKQFHFKQFSPIQVCSPKQFYSKQISLAVVHSLVQFDL